MFLEEKPNNQWIILKKDHFVTLRTIKWEKKTKEKFDNRDLYIIKMQVTTNTMV